MTRHRRGPAGPAAPEGCSPAPRGLRPFPLLVIALGPALALILYLSPAATRWAEYDRASIAGGQLWRWATCHWTHWSAEHLFYDAVVFGALAAAGGRRSGLRLLAALALATVAIPASLALALPEMSYYRGLSGLDAALFALLAGLLLADAWERRDRLPALGAGAALLALGAKILYELATGDALFLDQAAAGFVPVPLAHAVGAAAGLVAAFAGRRPLGRREPGPGTSASSDGDRDRGPFASRRNPRVGHGAYPRLSRLLRTDGDVVDARFDQVAGA